MRMDEHSPFVLYGGSGAIAHIEQHGLAPQHIAGIPGAAHMPPVQAGIVPSLLPAFSAPIGVRSAPRRATSASVSLANAGAAAPAMHAAAIAVPRIL